MDGQRVARPTANHPGMLLPYRICCKQSYRYLSIASTSHDIKYLMIAVMQEHPPSSNTISASLLSKFFDWVQNQAKLNKVEFTIKDEEPQLQSA